MTQCFGLKYSFTGFKTCIVSTSFYTVKIYSHFRLFCQENIRYYFDFLSNLKIAVFYQCSMFLPQIQKVYLPQLNHFMHVCCFQNWIINKFFYLLLVKIKQYSTGTIILFLLADIYIEEVNICNCWSNLHLDKIPLDILWIWGVKRRYMLYNLCNLISSELSSVTS